MMPPADSRTVFIRPAGPADAAALARVHRESWHGVYPPIFGAEYVTRVTQGFTETSWLYRLSAPYRRVITLVADQAPGEVVGFLQIGPQRSRIPGYTGEFHAIYLRPDVQRRRIGGRLMAAGARVLLANHNPSALVWAVSQNTSAIAFYKGLGGLPVGRQARGMAGRQIDEEGFGWPDLRRLAALYIDG